MKNYITGSDISTLGKNQLALCKFLTKYPERFHKIKGKKAIRAAISLEKRFPKSFIYLRSLRIVKFTQF